MQDLYAGLHGVIGILAALRHASLTGEGQHVEAWPGAVYQLNFCGGLPLKKTWEQVLEKRKIGRSKGHHDIFVLGSCWMSDLFFFE